MSNKWLLLLPLLLTGCVALVKELKTPPYPYTLIHHSRAVGIETAIPNQSGDSIFKLRLGWFSDTWSLIPCSTNEIFIPAISDAFKLGHSLGDSTISEDLATGWKNQPPPLRMMFTPR